MFTDAPKQLLDKIEQVVRLIRSKGVGVFFVTQNPLDVPETVLGQLGNRVQHALRAFTPRDQKAVKSAAETMRANPKFKTEAAITEMGVGEALVSFLDEKGRPTVVERVYVLPPGSRIGPATPEERKAVMAAVAGGGDLRQDGRPRVGVRKAQIAGGGGGASRRHPAATPAAPAGGGMLGGLSDILFGSTGPRGGKREGMVDAMAKSAARSVGSSLAREITRGVLGSLLGGKRR